MIMIVKAIGGTQVKSVEFCCIEMFELFDHGIVRLHTAQIAGNKIIAYFDITIEGEDEDSMRYTPISFCPFCGAKVKIEVIGPASASTN
jgi:hypothetical protein